MTVKKLSLKMDRELKNIYIGLFRKELESPEKWEQYSMVTNDDKYRSPVINDNGIYFVTLNKLPVSERTDYFYVYQIKDSSNYKVCIIKISFWDFKTQRMLERLFKFMPHKQEWLIVQQTTKILKSALGTQYDRLVKITKIKKKIG